MPHTLTDKDILSSALLSVKSMTHAYNEAASQTDDPQLVRELCEMISEEHNARMAIFEAMRQRGWYNPQLIDQQQLRQAQQRFGQMSQATTQSWTAPQPQQMGDWRQPGSTQWQQTTGVSWPQQSPGSTGTWQASTTWPTAGETTRQMQ